MAAVGPHCCHPTPNRTALHQSVFPPDPTPHATRPPAPQRCVNPIRRMQEKAYGMLASRAFVHQYEKYGMGVSDFQECFARIEDIVERYDRL